MPFACPQRPRIYYEERGDPGAPPLVLLRGLARSGRYWGELPKLLEEDFRLLLIDNRGVGRSDAPPPPYSTAVMADDVAAVLDDAGVERAHLFGVSLGGMIAQAFALGHPERLDRLVLGCTTPGGRRAVRYPARSLGRLILSGLLPPARSARVLAPHLLSDASAKARPEILDDWAELAATEPPARRGLLGQLWAGARHDLWDALPQVSAPTLVLSGDDDPLCLPANSRLLAERIPGAELVLLPGARHDFTRDRPEASAAVLRRFLLETAA